MVLLWSCFVFSSTTASEWKWVRRSPLDPQIAMTRPRDELARTALHVAMTAIARRLAVAYVSVICDEVESVMMKVLENEQLSMWAGFDSGIFLPKSVLDLYNCVGFHKCLTQLLNHRSLLCRKHAFHDTVEIGQVILIR